MKVVSHQRSSFTQQVPEIGFGWENFGVLKQVVAYIRGGPTQRINCIINYFIFVVSLTPLAPGWGGGGDSHMKQTRMLIGNFEFNP